MGINKTVRGVRHKDHINKVMFIAVVAFAFTGTPENGGIGVKIAFTRAQATKIALRMVRAFSGIDKDTGGKKFAGKIKRRKGDPFSVDACITGSNPGTANDPKFPLKDYFDQEIIKSIERLVKPGGQLEGHKPALQGDLAGPHIEGEYNSFLKREFKKRNWLLVPQAPQMPHANVCDNTIFPAMARRHTVLIRKNCKSVASQDEITSAAEKVWQDLPACLISRGFIHVWRLLKKVIKHKGDNKFLRTNEFHCNVRRDFTDTQWGVVRNEDYVEL